MKKLALTIAIVLTMGLGAYAQYDEGMLKRGFGYGDYRTEDFTTPLIPQTWGEVEDQDGDETPIGSGIAVLVGLGAAYMVAKKRREE